MPGPLPVSRDQFCHACGTAFSQVATYPRTCQNCQTQVWANPIPVAVILVPIRDGAREGLLVVRRGIPPQIGKLALIGGFVEDHESWQAGGAREVFEEVGVRIDAQTIAPMSFASSAPRPNRVLLFGVAASMELSELPPFRPSTESQSRGIIYGPAGLDVEFAFPLHTAAATQFFADRKIAADTPCAYRDV